MLRNSSFYIKDTYISRVYCNIFIIKLLIFFNILIFSDWIFLYLVKHFDSIFNTFEIENSSFHS